MAPLASGGAAFSESFRAFARKALRYPAALLNLQEGKCRIEMKKSMRVATHII